MRRLRRLHFAEKVTLLVTVTVALSGTSITLLTAYRFSEKTYEQEYSAAYTVYLATINYLTGHYYAHKGFREKGLDYVLTEHFLSRGASGEYAVTHRPAHIKVFLSNGALAYEFPREEGTPAPPRKAPDELPKDIQRWHDHQAETLHIAGPITDDPHFGAYAYVTFRTDIRSRIRALFREAFAIMLALLIPAFVVSVLLVRRVLKPVEALTQAAEKVRAGRFDPQVTPVGTDEIGMLTRTFNEMVTALGRRISFMRKVQEWTSESSRVLNEEKITGSYLNMCASLSSARSVALYLQSADGQSLAATRGEGPAPPYVNKALLDELTRDRRTRFFRADGTETTLRANPEHLLMPLQTGQGDSGAVWVGEPTAFPYYDEGCVVSLQTLSQHVAVAIENVHLYRELAEKERIKHEMELARQIQQGMLPRETPLLEGYELFGVNISAHEVGGDYYDYIAADHDQWQIVIGDVSGTGVAAALVMSTVRSLYHSFAEGGKSLRDIVAQVNRRLTPDLAADMFVTFAAVGVAPPACTLTVVRAGHEPLLIVRSSGDVESLAPDGAALGLLDIETFENCLQQATIELDTGDFALLFTDGTMDATNEDGVAFGMERLTDVAAGCSGRPAQEVVDVIAAELKKHIGDSEPFDDITMVVLRRTEGS